MHYLLKPVIASLIVISFFSCKKDDDKPSSSTTNSSVSGDVAQLNSAEPIDISDNGNSITILSNDNGAKLTSIANNGKLLWEKSYPGIQGRPVSLIESTDGLIFTTSISKLTSTEGAGYFGYFRQGFQCGSDDLKAYSLRFDSVRSSQFDQKTQVVKVNKNGDVVWNIALDHLQVGKLMTINKNTLFLSTINIASMYNNYTIDYRFGGTYPVITPTYFNSTMTYYEINLLNGSVIHQNQIDSSTTSGLAIINESYYQEQVLAGDQTIIAHEKGFINVSRNTSPLAFRAPFHDCENTVISNEVLNITKAGANNFYMIGKYVTDTTSNPSFYIASLDLNGNENWIIDGLSKIDPILLSADDSKGFYLMHRSGDDQIEYYDNQGNLMWDRSINNGNRVTEVITATSTSVTYVEERSDGFWVVKYVRS